jgi:carbonic anhydrase
MYDFADDPQDLIAGYRRFRAGRYREQADLFHRLRDGQKPATMIIACADSRADPSTIFDAAPGELFVLRNVAALVPPYQAGGGFHGVSAAIEYAVTILKVRQILIMGHGGCGGIAASLASVTRPPDGEFIGPWVKLADPARDAVLADARIPSHGHAEAMEQAAVAHSIANLKTFPFVVQALAEGRLAVDGAWFSIGRGELRWRDPVSGQFLVVDASETGAPA